LHNIQCDVCRKVISTPMHTYLSVEEGKPKERNFCSESHFNQWTKTRFQDITFDDEGNPDTNVDNEKARKENIILSIQRIQNDIHRRSIDDGNFSGKAKSDGEFIAMMHKHISDTMTAIKEPTKGSVEDGLANAVMSILDFSEWKGMNIALIIQQKLERKGRK